MVSSSGDSPYYGEDEPSPSPPTQQFGSDAWLESMTSAPSAVGRGRGWQPPASIVVHWRTPGSVRIFLALLVVAVVLLGSALLVTRRHGNNWMVEARHLQQVVTEGEDAARESAAALEQVEELLARSEEDVARLEGRLNALADEKAQAKDEAAAANVSATYLLQITQAAAAVTDRMNECIAYQDDWSSVLVDILNGYTYDRWRLEQFARELDATCADAQQLAWQLRDLVDSL